MLVLLSAVLSGVAVFSISATVISRVYQLLLALNAAIRMVLLSDKKENNGMIRKALSEYTGLFLCSYLKIEYLNFLNRIHCGTTFLS